MQLAGVSKLLTRSGVRVRPFALMRSVVAAALNVVKIASDFVLRTRVTPARASSAFLPCAEGLICVDAPFDSCDPNCGSTDYLGICVTPLSPGQ